MATTGWRLAANAENVTGTWNNLSNALAENDNVASFTTTTKNDARTFRAYNFGFDGVIPEGSTINQVDFRVRSSRTDGGTTTTWLRIGSTDGTTQTPANTSLTTNTYTSYSRPGGGAWTRADLLDGVLEAHFRGAQPNNTTSRTYNCAWLEVQVDYTEAAPSLLWHERYARMQNLLTR